MPHQPDLQELGRRGFEVREQQDVFQRRGVQVLRLAPVEELSERLTVRRAQVEESGIRGRVEGFLREAVEGQVHATVLRSHYFAPGARPAARFRWRRSRRGR